MEKSISILLVEDDPNLGMLTRDFLCMKGYHTTLCENGKQALALLAQQAFDFYILDVMLPEMDGFTLAREIRKNDKYTPLVFLTAKSLHEDTMEGFSIGADDYLTKPFRMEELLMRIAAILKRTKAAYGDKPKQNQITIGQYRFDTGEQVLYFQNQTIKLTGKESQLLQMLCERKNEILDRETALDAIWGDPESRNPRSMDVYLLKLRKYLQQDPSIEILTIHGRGLKLIEKSK